MTIDDALIGAFFAGWEACLAGTHRPDDAEAMRLVHEAMFRSGDVSSIDSDGMIRAAQPLEGDAAS